MKILVIEDKQKHRDSAQETLAGHNLTVLSTFDEAMDTMAEKVDEGKVRVLLAEAGFVAEPSRFPKEDDEDGRAYWQAYFKAKHEAEKRAVIPFPYEVVLVDMMMPVARKTALSIGLHPYDQEVPYGFVLALRAALRGAKYVAMVTDTNHHKGAMSAALDYIDGASFTVNGAKCMFVHARFIEDPALGVDCYNCVGGTACGYCRTPLTPEGKCPRCQREGRALEPCFVCKGKGKHDTTVHERKDWGKVLADLVK